MRDIYTILVIALKVLAPVAAARSLGAEPTSVDLEDTSSSSSSSSLEPGSDGFLGPSPWQLGFLWGAIAGLAVAMCFEIRAYRSRQALQDLEDCRPHFEDDFVPHGTENLDDLESVVESLDMESHGTPPPQFSLKPASSFRSTTTQSSSSYEDDASEKSPPSLV
jgi:hypothetical protein